VISKKAHSDSTSVWAFL